MTEFGADVSSESKESKPILIKQLKMPVSDWYALKANEGDNSEKDDISPFREKLAKMVGEGELSQALLDTEEKYVFRCFTRRSDDQPLKEYQSNSTINDAYVNLHNLGLELDLQGKDSVNVSPARMWFEMLEPNLENGIDRSFIIVYKNEDEILTRRKSLGIRIDTSNTKRGLGRIFSKIINMSSNKPSMRDLLVGVVEIDWKAQ